MKKVVIFLLVVLIILNSTFLMSYAFEDEMYSKNIVPATYQQQSYEESGDSTGLVKKCFLNPEEHFANILAPDADNVAFAVGMLNPINLVLTVVGSPLILLFWPMKTLK